MDLDETYIGEKIDARNINNFRYTEDTTLLSETEEGPRNLMKRIKD